MRYLYFFLFVLFPFSTYAGNVVNVGQLNISPSGPGISNEIIDLGLESRRGVEAHVSIAPQPALDLEQSLAQNSRYFLLSLEFIKTATGESLLAGQAAVRVFSANNRVTQTVRLEPQEGQWTAKVLLDTRGESLIKIGSKLSDGKKRIYRFFFNQPTDKLPADLPR
jgi:hypothetical protein